MGPASRWRFSSGQFEPGGRLLCLVRDITERKRGEDAPRASEERFRTLVQFSFDAYWESDTQHRFIRQEFAEGLIDAPAPGSEIGKARWEVPYVEPDEEAWRKHREALDAHLPFRDFELARPTPDGGTRYVSVSGMPVFDAKGDLSAIAASGGTSPSANGVSSPFAKVSSASGHSSTRPMMPYSWKTSVTKSWKSTSGLVPCSAIHGKNC